MKGITTCKVCGQDFPLIAKAHYVARDPEKMGAFANLANTDKAIEYDTFDCPHCGCQNVMQDRKPSQMPKAHDNEKVPEHDGCLGCIFFDVSSYDNPCCNCVGTHIDFYEKEDK